MDRPIRWTWQVDGTADRVGAELDRCGLAWFHDPTAPDAVERDPIGLATRVLGTRPWRLSPDRLEVRLGIHRGYQHTSGRAHYHIDPEPYLPPNIQLLVCVRPAEDGGDSVFVDGWEVAAAIEADDPALFARLFTVARVIPFSHNQWFGPTIALRHGHTLFAHGAMPPAPGDAIGPAILARLARTEPVAFRLAAGDVLVASNHRLLHGRTAFADHRRLLFRQLLWLDRELAAPPAYTRAASRVHVRIAEQVGGHPAWIRNRLGVLDRDPAAWPYPTPDSTSPDRLAELVAAAAALRLEP